MVPFNLLDKGVHAFPKGISPKGNVIEPLAFKFTYYDVTVQHVNHYSANIYLIL